MEGKIPDSRCVDAHLSQTLWRRLDLYFFFFSDSVSEKRCCQSETCGDLSHLWSLSTTTSALSVSALQVLGGVIPLISSAAKVTLKK